MPKRPTRPVLGSTSSWPTTRPGNQKFTSAWSASSACGIRIQPDQRRFQMNEDQQRLVPFATNGSQGAHSEAKISSLLVRSLPGKRHSQARVTATKIGKELLTTTDYHLS